jgi:hypothetical protein
MPYNLRLRVSESRTRGWEAVDFAEERLRQRAILRERTSERRRRRRGAAVWALRVLLPLLGAAAVVAVLERAGGDLRRWSLTAAVAALLAAVLLPALASAWLARRDSLAEAVLWALVTLAAEVALVFGVGLLALGLGPA